MNSLQRFWRWLEAWLLWVVVTGTSWAMGLIIALAMAQATSQVLPLAVRLIVGALVCGVLISVAHWLFLQPQARGFGWWLVATTVGWMIGLAAASIALAAADSAWGVIASGIVGGLVFGLAQWLALRRGTGQGPSWVATSVLGWSMAFALSLGQDSGNGGLLANDFVHGAAVGAVGLVLLGIVALILLVVVFRQIKRDRGLGPNWFRRPR